MPGEDKATSDYTYPSDAARTADINFIMDATRMENGAPLLDLSDPALRKAYEKAAKDAESGKYDRNIGGAVHNTYQELGYMHGGVHKGKTSPKTIKYSKGGAVRGRTFSGSY
jgi:hypothetical protein